jgi:hypothetical protein
MEEVKGGGVGFGIQGSKRRLERLDRRRVMVKEAREEAGDS